MSYSRLPSLVALLLKCQFRIRSPNCYNVRETECHPLLSSEESLQIRFSLRIDVVLINHGCWVAQEHNHVFTIVAHHCNNPEHIQVDVEIPLKNADT